jgi:hypothetical protein
MDLLEIYAEWKKHGFWNQVGITSGFVSLLLAILALADVQMELINLSFVFLFIGFCLLVYGNIQQSRKLVEANDKLSQVDDRINQAIASVYAHKDQEIGAIKRERDQIGFLLLKLTNISKEDIENEITVRKLL